MSESPQEIGIIGAGPGGLVAARILTMHGKKVTVLERETSFSARAQGGSLDMHADAGQLALRRAGLTEQFLGIARYADQEARLYDKHGTLRHADTNVAGKDRPETDRGHLRKMLLDSLPRQTVQWGCSVVGVACGERRHAVQLANGTVQEFDHIIGADGTWSKVRPLLSSATPSYTGILVIEFGIDEVEQRYPDTASMAGRGLTFALGDSQAIVAHRDANEHLGGYVGLRVSADWFRDEGLAQMDERASRERLCHEFSDWSERLLLWIRRSEGPLVPRPIYELPIGHRWSHRPGITLLGDAAHVMSPFGGDGANLAMLDGADLAEALLQPDWHRAVRECEDVLCVRAESASAQASAAIQSVFSPQGLEHTLLHFRNVDR